MKADVQRAAIAAPLKALAKVTEPKLPILAGIQFVGEGPGETGGGLSLRATDGDRWLVYRVAGTAKGSAVLPAKAIAEFVARLPDQQGQVKFTPQRDGHAVKASSGRYRVTMPSLSIEDAPTLPVLDADPIEVDGQSIATAFAFCNVACGSDDSRYYLMGVHVAYVALDGQGGEGGEGGDAGALQFTATNGHIMTRCRVPVAVMAIPPDPVIIPREAISSLVDVCHGRNVAFTLTPSHVAVTTEEVDLYSKLIDGTFPDVDRIIPPTPPALFTVATAELVALIDSIKAVVGKTGQMSIVWKRSAKTARVMARSVDTLIEFEGDMPIDHPARDEASPLRDVTISIAYLSGMVAAYATLSVPAITFRQAEPGAAIVIEAPADFVGVAGIIMPIRATVAPGDEGHDESE